MLLLVARPWSALTLTMLTARLCPPFSRLEHFVICAIANVLACATLLYFCSTDFICWEKPPRRPCALADLKPEWEGPQPSARSPPNSWQGYCGSYSSLAFLSSKREDAKNMTRTITASCCKTARSSINALQLQNPSAQLHVESTFHRFEVDARCALIAA